MKTSVIILTVVLNLALFAIISFAAIINIDPGSGGVISLDGGELSGSLFIPAKVGVPKLGDSVILTVKGDIADTNEWKVHALGVLYDNTWKFCCCQANCGYGDGSLCSSTGTSSCKHDWLDQISLNDQYSNKQVKYSAVVFAASSSPGVDGKSISCLDAVCPLTKKVDLVIDTPRPSSPLQKTTTSIQPILRVSAISGHDYKYHFYARTSSETIDTATLKDCSDSNEYLGLGLSDGTTYFWSAKACILSGCADCGDYAGEGEFTTINKPTLTSPEDGARTTLDPTLEVSRVKDAASYHFYARTGSQSVGGATKQCSPTIEKRTFSGLSDGTTYFWSAKACVYQDCTECGRYADEWSFTAGTTKECDKNDLAGGTLSSQCVKNSNQYLECDLSKFTCKTGPCTNTIDACLVGFCCETDPVLTTPEDINGNGFIGDCVSQGSRANQNKFLCSG